MVLFNDFVEVLVLAYHDIDVRVGLDAFNGCCVGAALVNGDLLWHIVQVDGTLQKAPRCCLISLGREKKVHRIAGAVNRPVKVLSLACGFDVGLIHPPA